MYYQNYEDYMRTVLGYPREQNTYEMYPDMARDISLYQNQVNYSDELLDLYPDIYKIINPMVQKICEANTKPITRELLEQMTNEIYLNIENVPEIETRINVKVNTTNSVNRDEMLKSRNSKTVNSKSEEQKENREDRQRFPNRTLQDLIRILILNQLLGINRPPRPRPPRPPYIPGRPPFPREDNYYMF